jgi:hypothetical protein
MGGREGGREGGDDSGRESAAQILKSQHMNGIRHVCQGIDFLRIYLCVPRTSSVIIDGVAPRHTPMNFTMLLCVAMSLYMCESV